jgi:hypothetical protein
MLMPPNLKSPNHRNIMKTILRSLPFLVAISVNATASTVLYSTNFGFPPFNPGDSWIGQDGWQGNISNTSAAQGTFGSPDNGVLVATARRISWRQLSVHGLLRSSRHSRTLRIRARHPGLLHEPHTPPVTLISMP